MLGWPFLENQMVTNAQGSESQNTRLGLPQSLFMSSSCSMAKLTRLGLSTDVVHKWLLQCVQAHCPSHCHCLPQFSDSLEAGSTAASVLPASCQGNLGWMKAPITSPFQWHNIAAATHERLPLGRPRASSSYIPLPLMAMLDKSIQQSLQKKM